MRMPHHEQVIGGHLTEPGGPPFCPDSFLKNLFYFRNLRYRPYFPVKSGGFFSKKARTPAW